MPLPSPRRPPPRPRCCAAATLWAALPAVAVLVSAVPSSAQPSVRPTSPPSTSPSGPPPYETVAGDDWRRFRSAEELRATGRFWWTRPEEVTRRVEWVADPLFGRVARVVFPASPEPGFAPRMTTQLPAPLERMWLRWRMRFSPGWTTAGSNPPGHANSYKVAFWLWEGFDGRGQVEISNTDQYVLGWSVMRDGRWLPFRKEHLPGHREFGRVSTEWSDGEWWEFVAFYEKTGATAARQHWWRRRLTTRGRVAPGAWTYSGIALSGSPTPRVRAVTLGANRNKNNPATMHIDWGPWEVVDGARFPDPFGLLPRP